MVFRHASRSTLLKKGVDFLRKDYERNEFTIDLARYVGFWAHPLYYVIWTAILPQPYESPLLRFASAITFIPLFFFKRYPVRFRPWVNLYWYLWLTFTLPVIFTFLMLMNNLSGMWLVCETMMILVFLFIPNSFLMTFLLVAGMLIAYAGFVFSTGTHLVITTEIIEYMLPIPMAILLVLLFVHTTKKEAMEQRNRALQSLAGSIAHEMRNPLGQIRHCLNSIQNHLPSFHPERPAESINKGSLDRIYHNVAHGQMAVKRGVQAVDMVLDEIREKPINPDSFTYLSAVRITRKAVDEYGYDSENDRRRVHLDTRETFTFRIDETLFIFVLFNLLKNAVYYFRNHADSEIRIRLKSGSPYNYLFFRDTGPGIAKEDLLHIFDSFHTSGKKGGTGLGLAYCKRVMNAFGGDIHCNSVKGKYTEFTLSFPVVDTKKLTDYTARVIANALPDFRGKRLLIVDDEHRYRMTVREHLLPLEVEIDEAANGREALDWATKNRYDLIIMDLNMPVMNGYETVDRLRRGEAGAEAGATPVIAYSAEPAYIAQTMAEKAGMQAFLAKPCNQAELVNALRAALYAESCGQSETAMLDGQRALLVDDSALNRDLLAMSLTDTGLQVAVAENGAEGWDILQRKEFDLLITDIRMPEMDGLELTRLLRASAEKHLHQMPVIGLSGTAEEEEAARAAGMDDFQLKTDSPDLLIASIRKLLASSSTVNPTDITPPPMNPAASAASHGLSPADMENLFRTFLDEFRNTPAAMHKALAEHNIKELQEQAHRLKGSAALLGAESVQQAANALEQSCRLGQTGELEKQVESLLAALAELSKLGGQGIKDAPQIFG